MNALDVIQRIPPLRALFHRAMVARCHELADRWRPFVPEAQRILDVGCGTCHGSAELQRRGHDVTPLDVIDQCTLSEFEPILYDGERFPFEDDSFDTAMIITVLHHAVDPVQVVREAARVAPRVIVIEDVYKNTMHKWLTWVVDSVLNAEFFGHPRTNKSDAGWREVFESLELEVLDTHDTWTVGVIWQVTYHLRRRPQTTDAS